MLHDSRNRFHTQKPERSVGRTCGYVSRTDIGAAATVCQHGTDIVLRDLQLDMMLLVLIKQGCKNLSAPGINLKAGEGDIVIMMPGQPLVICNEPVPGGRFLSTWVAMPQNLTNSQPSQRGSRPVHAAARLEKPPTAMIEALEAAAKALADPLLPDGIIRHRMTELLLWLTQCGLHIGQSCTKTTAQRVRELLAKDIVRTWTCAEMARELAMSEATLRRRLADEGTGFQSIAIDLRMTHALNLVQLTRQSMTQIAATVGYESASRFSARFAERFGMAPLAMRGLHDHARSRRAGARG